MRTPLLVTQVFIAGVIFDSTPEIKFSEALAGRARKYGIAGG
jgi:hypothetical protein